MVGRVPVLRQDDVLEVVDELVDDGHDLVAACNAKRAAGTEIVLQIDNDQCLGAHQPLLCMTEIGWTFDCMRAAVNGFFDASSAWPGRRL